MEFELKETPSGHVTCVSESGLYLHSKYDPLLEAKRQIESLTNLDHQVQVIFIGGGLAYTVASFLQRANNLCYWFESNTKLRKTALKINSSLAHADSQLQIIDELPSEAKLLEIFNKVNPDHLKVIYHRPSYSLSLDYATFDQLLANFLNKRKINTRTMERFATFWIHNLLANFPSLSRAKSIDRLQCQYSRTPAVVCGAGPSLHNDIEQLKKMYNKIILIATDSAVKVLVRENIDPHFIVSIDPQPINYYYLNDYQGMAKFIIDPSSCYLNVRNIPMNSLYYTGATIPIAEKLFELIDEKPSKLAAGGSVSTVALDLAIKLGADPIFLLGQDMAFSYQQAHVRGSAIEEYWSFSTNRVRTAETLNAQQLTALEQIQLPGIEKKNVVSNMKFEMLYRWYNKQGEIYKDRIINSTSAGVKIENMIHRKLENIELSEIDAHEKVEEKPLIQAIDSAKVRKKLARLLSEFSDFRILIEKVMQNMRNLISMKNSKERRQIIMKINKLDTQIKKSKNILEYINILLSQETSKLSFSVNNSSENQKDAAKIIEQHLLFYGAMAEAVLFYIKHLERLIVKNKIWK